MGNSFTKGPWEFRAPCTVRHSPIVVSPEGDCLTTVWSAQTTTNIDRPKDLPGEANARLIAAAPEMFEALQRITDCYGVGYKSADQFCKDVHDYMMEGRAALAKAASLEPYGLKPGEKK